MRSTINRSHFCGGALIIAAAAILSGCAGGPLPQKQMYSGPELSSREVAQVDGWATSNRSARWHAVIVEINDATVSQERMTLFQFKPGMHKFKIKCVPSERLLNEGRVTGSEGYVSVKLEAGKRTYHPRCTIDPTIIRGDGSRAPDGRIVGSVAAGRLRPYISSNFPNQVGD